jgi:hypothetical protein
MRYKTLWVVTLLLVVSLQLSACRSTADEAAQESSPATVEHLEAGGSAADSTEDNTATVEGLEMGLDATRITLTEEAAARLDIQTDSVRDEQVNGLQQRVIPYAALLYDAEGNTWTYTNAAPLTFVRQAITVDRIEGDLVVLTKGPALGTAVVTVGATELYGSESEFEEE